MSEHLLEMIADRDETIERLRDRCVDLESDLHDAQVTIDRLREKIIDLDEAAAGESW